MNNKATIYPSYFDKNDFIKLNPFPTKEMEFFPADDESRFLQNLKTQPEDWHYRTKKVRYKLNSHGYRAPEFNTVDWANSVVLLGCSCTFGVGVDEDETISHYMSEILNRPVINMGWAGGSNQVMLMNAFQLKQHFPAPYALVILWSTTDRFMLFTDIGVHNVGPWDMVENVKNIPHKTSYNDIYTRCFEGLNFFLENETIQNYFIAEYAKAFWKDSTRYITGTFFGSTANMLGLDLEFKIDNGARDLIHNGRKSNLEAATTLSKLIESYHGKDYL